MIRDRVRGILRGHGLGNVNPLGPSTISWFCENLIVAIRQPEATELAAKIAALPEFPLDEGNLFAVILKLHITPLLHTHLAAFPTPSWAPPLIAAMLKDASPEDALAGTKPGASR